MAGRGWRALAVAAGVLVATLPGCSSGSPLTPRQLSFGGLTRTWYEHVPAGVHRPAPLVILLHGFEQQPLAIVRASGFNASADKDGFVLVVPQAAAGGWDAGTCCGPSDAGRVDDVGFLSSLISGLVGDGTADGRRVYVAGFSNGAMMAWRLACERANLVAGAAVVEGTLTSSCPSHPPRSLLAIHQQGDGVVPYGGTATTPANLGATGRFVPVPAALDAWLAAEGCRTSPGTVRTPAVTTTTWACGEGASTQLDLLPGGAHTWPNGALVPFKATDAVTRFFGLNR